MAALECLVGPLATHTGQPVFSKAAVRTGANYLLGPAPPLLL